MKRLIVSPVGISLLINYARYVLSDTSLARQIGQQSNQRTLDPKLDGQLEQLGSQITTYLHQSALDERRKLSAELNGLYGLFPNGTLSPQDVHLLIATDTALGQTTVRILDDFLRTQGTSVDIIRPPGLQTNDEVDFRQAMRALFLDLERRIPNYKCDKYEIIFNLTGGFKSLQGYLSTVGMFYADKIVYIFENGSTLLSIPRLPLKIDDASLRESDRPVQLALLAAGHIFRREEIDLPGALWEEDEQGDVTISEWGMLIWQRIKQDILTQDLLPFPRLEYEQSFRKQFKKAPKQRRIELQEVLAKVSDLLIRSNGDPSILKQDKGLQYENYTGKRLPNGTPIGHFRINDGDRVTCVASNGILRLRFFGTHDKTERKEGIQ